MNYGKDNVFSGICLLSTREFELNHILLNLRQNFGIRVNADMDEYEENENGVVFSLDGLDCFINFVDSKILDEEIGLKASFNYMFEDAVTKCLSHTSYITVGVIGGENRVQSALLFTKLATACLMQYNAIALYTTYNVIEADYFIQEAMYIKDDFLPIENWIYIGFIQNEDDTVSGYTIGMKNFFKDEMEILYSNEDTQTIRNRLLNIAYFVIDTDTELSDEETLTLDEFTNQGNKVKIELKIKYDEAVNGTGKTLKIENRY